jgi:predicted nucleic acid-binding protein
MLVLDTNVLSAVMGSQPVAAVAVWLARQLEDQLYTTTVCQAEILAGIAILPEGRRRQLLDAAARAIFETEFEGRILPFDQAAADHYAVLFASHRKAGRPTSQADLMIAAIARSQGASLATRNVGDFEGCDIRVLNPWDVQPNV